MGGWAGQRCSEKATGLRAPRRVRSSAAWSPHHPCFRCFSASLGARVCWGGRCHAPGTRWDRGGWMLRHAQGHDHPARFQWGRRRTSALRGHARGGAWVMARPHAPRTPPASTQACMRQRACPCPWGTPSLLSHGHDSAGRAEGAGGVHPPRRSSGCAGPPGCRSGETRRLLRSLSRTTRPPRAARAGLPGDARTRVSAATNTVPPSQG